MSTRLASLAQILACPACEAWAWTVAGTDIDGVLTCGTCQARFACADGVLDLGERQQDEVVALEREAVRRTERDAALGGINAEFDDLARAEGDLRAAILALPYGNDSSYYREPGYFSNVRASVRAFEFLLAHLDVKPGARLLELGADLTWATSFMALQGLDCTAVDINHHLSVGRLFSGSHRIPYHLVRADMRSVSFRPDTFDIVLAMNALHHASGLERVASNAARMLRPGGQLALVEPYVATDAAKVAFGRAQIDAGIHEQTYRLDEWHDAFKAAGLHVQAVRVCESFGAIYRKAAPRAVAGRRGVEDLFADFYRGGVSVPDRGRRIAAPGETFAVPITIRNDGNGVWCSESQFPTYASYHLYTRRGDHERLVAFDNVRSVLPADVTAPRQATMPLEIRAPEQPGEYVAQVDLVHEHVSWFAPRGFVSAAVPFVVRPSRG
jgi:SAM-dependent methyltransferase